MCRDRVWPWMGLLCRDIKFQDMGFPWCDIAFYVAIVGHDVASQQGRACARQRCSVTHNRPWAWATMWRRVASRQKRPCTLDRLGQARITRDCVHDRGISNQKKNPWIWGVTAWYQSLGKRLPRELECGYSQVILETSTTW